MGTELASAGARKRVALVYHFFAHYRGAVLRELRERGAHDYRFYGDTLDRKEAIKPFEFGPNAPFVEARTRFFRGGAMWQSGMIRLALDPNVDAVVYLGDAHYLSTWVSASLARRAGKRVFFWTIGWLRDERGSRTERLRESFYRLANGLLLYGNWAKERAIERGWRSEDVHVIYNSLDTRKQSEARTRVTRDVLVETRERLFPGSHAPVLVCTTRLIAKRKLDEVLEAMALLKAEGHPVNLLLVGDGPEKERLQTLAAEHDLNVCFYGACYDEDELAPLVMCANATVAPGMVGLTAMQSLAYGTPVVTHDDFNNQAPEWEAIVPGLTGGFFRFGDVADLARVVREWTSTELPNEATRSLCYRVIDEYYNPENQRRLIDRAISGEPALPVLDLRDRLAGEHASNP